MSRLFLPAALGLLLLASGASAQDSDGGDPIPPTNATYAGHPFTIAADEPLAACVVESEATLDSRWETLAVFGRNDQGQYVVIGTFRTRQTGPLENVYVGDCLFLERVP